LPARRCTYLRTVARSPRIPSGCFALGLPCSSFCVIDRHKIDRPTLGLTRSALRCVLAPTMASA